jgi:hypothetical protein
MLRQMTRLARLICHRDAAMVQPYRVKSLLKIMLLDRCPATAQSSLSSAPENAAGK